MGSGLSRTSLVLVMAALTAGCGSYVPTGLPARGVSAASSGGSGGSQLRYGVDIGAEFHMVIILRKTK